MADEVDVANDQIEAALEAALAEAQHQTGKGLPFTGACYNCREDVVFPRRFCDDECRDDYQHRLKMRKIAGVA